MGDSIPPPLRGWIVPVGDSIPDRREELGGLIGEAKRRFAGRIPKQSLGTTGFDRGDVSCSHSGAGGVVHRAQGGFRREGVAGNLQCVVRFQQGCRRFVRGAGDIAQADGRA